MGEGGRGTVRGGVCKRGREEVRWVKMKRNRTRKVLTIVSECFGCEHFL